MYTINDAINLSPFDGLKAGKILDINAKEILCISLEKDAVFPKHTSPTDAHLLVLEGEISFFINDASYTLKPHQVFNFPKEKEHWVEAVENSKFLIIR
jgi:quercetin dioxygenase-like cupin family protein